MRRPGTAALYMTSKHDWYSANQTQQLGNYVSIKRYPIRTVESSIERLDGSSESTLLKNQSQDLEVELKKVLRMIDESEERPPAYFLYND